MTEKPDTLKTEREQPHEAGSPPHRERVLEALQRLREIGEKLPAVDAVAVVREGRDASGRGER
jgi:hypothetical protein